MPNKRKVQQLPSIMIEDFDSREVRFAYTSFPINLSPPATDECTTVIRPHVDAYVTPLSLCHASTPITPIAFPDKTLIAANGRVPTYPDDETSFTSIDIGGLNTSKVTPDCSMNSSNSGRSDTGCFDIRSGLMRVTQSITTGIGTGFEQAHGRDFHLEMPTTPSKPRAKKKRDFRYAIGLFFVFLAFAVVVAVCVTVYVELVAKPSWSASTMNDVSSICDFIVNGCDYNNTSVMSHLVNHTVALNNSGRTEGKISERFPSETSK